MDQIPGHDVFNHSYAFSIFQKGSAVIIIIISLDGIINIIIQVK